MPDVAASFYLKNNQKQSQNINMLNLGGKSIDLFSVVFLYILNT